MNRHKSIFQKALQYFDKCEFAARISHDIKPVKAMGGNCCSR